ncbi:hypothetical protein [Streptomyces abikoensis]
MSTSAMGACTTLGTDSASMPLPLSLLRAAPGGISAQLADLFEMASLSEVQ